MNGLNSFTDINEVEKRINYLQHELHNLRQLRAVYPALTNIYPINCAKAPDLASKQVSVRNILGMLQDTLEETFNVLKSDPAEKERFSFEMCNSLWSLWLDCVESHRQASESKLNNMKAA